MSIRCEGGYFCPFCEKSAENIWWFRKKCVPLHPQIRNADGSVAQLNRASDYGSEGCGFESRRNHKQKEMETESELSSLYFSFCPLKAPENTIFSSVKHHLFLGKTSSFPREKTIFFWGYYDGVLATDGFLGKIIGYLFGFPLRFLYLCSLIAYDEMISMTL